MNNSTLQKMLHNPIYAKCLQLNVLSILESFQELEEETSVLFFGFFLGVTWKTFPIDKCSLKIQGKTM